jgi:hypothetical protein
MVKVVSILKLALGLPAGCLRGRRKIRIIQEGCSAALLQRISRISAVFYKIKNALTPEQTSSSLKEQYTLPLAA